MITAFGRSLLRTSQAVGELLALATETLYYCRRIPQSVRPIALQMVHIGIHTLPIGILMAFFVGMVLALNTGIVLIQYGGTGYIGGIVGMSMVKELGPVMTSYLVAGRIGSSMAAEIGAMQVYEEIDALYTLQINPVRYLVMPRFVACVLTLPALVTFVMLVGIAGGGLVCMSNPRIQVPLSVYYEGVLQTLDIFELFKGLAKSVVFGAIISLVGCYSGFRTQGGSRGIGLSTTRAVVMSFLLILVADYFLTRVLM